VRSNKTKGPGPMVAVLVVAWLASGQSLSAASDVKGVPTSEETPVANCQGCHGITGYADEAFAPPSCAQTPYGAWMISVAVDVFDGECETVDRGGHPACLGSPCTSKVVYSWGSEVADADLELGYRKSFPGTGLDSVWLFGEEPPWEPGKSGSVTFEEGSSPDLSCGLELTYFIRGELCGAAFEAGVFGRCTPCKTQQ
jgi:hypothetical protein